MAGKRIGDGTAAGLAEYLDVLVEKGRATEGAIRPLKTAFVKVVKKVDGDAWGDVRVEAINVEEYVSRFSVLTRGTYTPRSIAVYKMRARRVVDWYLRFMSPDEAGYMPQIDTRTPRAAALKDTLSDSAAESNAPASEAAGAAVAPAAETRSSGPAGHPVASAGLIDYPFPMADGNIAVLRLPAGITAGDAGRIAQFVNSLVVG